LDGVVVQGLGADRAGEIGVDGDDAAVGNKVGQSVWRVRIKCFLIRHEIQLLKSIHYYFTMNVSSGKRKYFSQRMQTNDPGLSCAEIGLGMDCL
jgi:hypothetical protein